MDDFKTVLHQEKVKKPENAEKQETQKELLKKALGSKVVSRAKKSVAKELCLEKHKSTPASTQPKLSY